MNLLLIRFSTIISVCRYLNGGKSDEQSSIIPLFQFPIIPIFDSSYIEIIPNFRFLYNRKLLNQRVVRLNRQY
jgi:hypothetical protein